MKGTTDLMKAKLKLNLKWRILADTGGQDSGGWLDSAIEMVKVVNEFINKNAERKKLFGQLTEADVLQASSQPSSKSVRTQTQ